MLSQGSGGRFAPLDFPKQAAGGSPGLFDAVFEACGTGVLICDLEPERPRLVVADANPAFLSVTGTSRDRLIGRNFLDLFDRKAAADAVLHFARLAARHEPVTGRVALARAGGGPLWGKLSLRPVGSKGTRPRMVGVFRCEEGSLEDALAEARRERDAALGARHRLLARLSHDLRTPLNGILGFAELIGTAPEARADNVRTRDYARDISAAGRELLMQVEDLLAAAENGTADSAPDDELLDIGELLAAAARGPAVPDGAAPPLWRIEPGMPALAGARAEIVRLFGLLLGNALRAAPPGSPLTIDAALTASGSLRVRFVDRGPPPEEGAIRAVELLADDDLAERDVWLAPVGRPVAGLAMAGTVMRRHGGSLRTGPGPGGRGCCIEIEFPPQRMRFAGSGLSGSGGRI